MTVKSSDHYVRIPRILYATMLNNSDIKLAGDTSTSPATSNVSGSRKIQLSPENPKINFVVMFLSGTLKLSIGNYLYTDKYLHSIKDILANIRMNSNPDECIQPNSSIILKDKGVVYIINTLSGMGHVRKYNGKYVGATFKSLMNGLKRTMQVIDEYKIEKPTVLFVTPLYQEAGLLMTNQEAEKLAHIINEIAKSTNFLLYKRGF